ncbi:Ypt/Rab-GAP domain of gyp1p superfamily protein isoform 2 [Hibiscus syriacus]|uniref:Ypt/Rab-GAP domain of gyp1p superfamily protein isoform 2 n=1 Tax=Hibiscus syriacus TaxID=106335 RepID=A0A6A3B0F6_HIBSY|nr:Ypt/Rab-GAP domain of gyp1p superfamily protein isoform 2 [Hibiscus syriacus]
MEKSISFEAKSHIFISINTIIRIIASNTSSSSSSSWIHLRSVLLAASSSSSLSSSSSSSQPLQTDRGSLKSPWSHRRRKHALLPKQWKNLFPADGKLVHGGVKFLKKIRSGGVDPSIRAEVWPFLLGVEEYESLRKQYRQILKRMRRMRDVGKRAVTSQDACTSETESSDSNSYDELENTPLLSSEITEENNIHKDDDDSSSPPLIEGRSASHTDEDFATWRRIILLDASVGLKDYDDLEPCRIFHAARLVSILEAYALYDPEIGFMKRARHNFRLDDMAIRRQLNIVSKIIKCKDNHLYIHLEKLQAEDCFFVYRMVIVLFRRELNFEQTLCLWEVMWADQAAIRAGIAKSAWGRMRARAPPTDDLLLYAMAACVLQRRKLITEKYSSMDEIMKECNSMAGHLDVWKLLDDAHDLVVNLLDKI